MPEYHEIGSGETLIELADEAGFWADTIGIIRKIRT